jgi:hypothetical protein
MKLTPEQEVKIILKYLNMTKKEFDNACEVGYKKVIAKRKGKDQ